MPCSVPDSQLNHSSACARLNESAGISEVASPLRTLRLFDLLLEPLLLNPIFQQIAVTSVSTRLSVQRTGTRPFGLSLRNSASCVLPCWSLTSISVYSAPISSRRICGASEHAPGE